ncbi:MAG: hypothetical protein QOK43_1487 [Acidimicrobiaceae bacterium]|nr:hypothetical protein [Acidimicrobiaceae bacterium]
MRISHSGRLALLLTLSLLAPTALAVGAGPAAAAAPTLGVVIDSESGDPVGGGEFHTFDQSNSTITVTPTSTSTITFDVSAPQGCSGGSCTSHYTITMSTPGGAAFAETTYDNAIKTSDADHPGLNVTGKAVCDTVAGRFITDDVGVTGPLLTKFQARFEQHCNGAAPALFGSVSFNGTKAWRSRNVSPNTGEFGDVRRDTSSTKTFTLTNHGDGFNPAGFNIAGPDAARYVIQNNTCTVTGVQDACTLDVVFTPTADGPTTAVLNWVDELAPPGPPGDPSTTGTGRDVPLSGVGTRSELTVTGTGLFGEARVGLVTAPRSIVATNTGTDPVVIGTSTITGTGATSFLSDGGCDGRTLNPSDTCTILVLAYPTGGGLRSATLNIGDNAAPAPHTVPLTVIGTQGYYLAEANGRVWPFGDAADLDDMSGQHLNAPVLGITTTSSGDGFWLVSGDGGIFGFGDATFHGSTGGMTLNQPVLGMASRPDDSGYWLAALDGGVFAFDAPFYGSMGGKHLNAPIVGLAAIPDGSGYWLVASDGGIFAFGSAANRFYGSMGGKPLNAPIIGMAPAPDGLGYWLIASDGGLFAFGSAANKFYGSLGGTQLNKPVRGMTADPTGFGYWLFESDGRVFPFGDAPSFGSTAAEGINDVVGMARTAPFVNTTT